MALDVNLNFMEDDFLLLLGRNPQPSRSIGHEFTEKGEKLRSDFWYLQQGKMKEKLYLILPIQNVQKLCLECAAECDGVEMLLLAEKYLREGSWAAALINPADWKSLDLYWANFYPIYRYAEIPAAELRYFTGYRYKGQILHPLLTPVHVSYIAAWYKEQHKDEFARLLTLEEAAEAKSRLISYNYTQKWNIFFDKFHKIINN